MEIQGWKYYNHAAIPSTPPHEVPNMQPLSDGSIWKIEGKNPLFASYTTDFDTEEETLWWYVIKDTPFDISSLKAKRRYEINKGIKHFEVKEIDLLSMKDEVYRVLIAAYSAYPEKYRPTVDEETFSKDLEIWKDMTALGAFFRESGELASFSLLPKEKNGYVDFKMMRSDPAFEKYSVNAAMVEGVMRHFEAFLSQGGYICDGSRSVNHETSFQDYLEKYFGFRKAYGRLQMVYNPKVKGLIKFLFPFRGLLLKFDGIGIVHKLNSVLRMEEISRKNQKRNS